MVKYKINDLYRAKLTKVEVPEYATDSHFIRQSNKEFIFVKDGENYIEVFTQITFTEVVEDVYEATCSKSLISPQPLKASYFKKNQRKLGEVNQANIIPVYRTINEPRKKLVKRRAA